MQPLDWRGFLEEFGRELLSDETIRVRLPREVVDSGWLGYEPATASDIAALEARLGMELPNSYKSFLLVSNGWRVTGPFIDEVCSTSRVRWFRDDNQPWIDAYTNPLLDVDPSMADVMMDFLGEDALADIPDDEYFRYGKNQNPLFRQQYLQTALQVSEVGDAAVYLLCPDGKTPSGEWEVWFFANWIPGAQRYGSFQMLMEGAWDSFRELRR